MPFCQEGKCHDELQNPSPGAMGSQDPESADRTSPNTVQSGKTGTDTHFLLLEIGSLPQRFAALTEQLTGQSCEPHTRQPTPPSAILFQVEISV
jgi:hypothetical protein